MITLETSMISKAWDDIAICYDRYVTPTSNWALAKKALGLAGLKNGMRFLDVASGSGALSLPAARLGAEVLAVDFSSAMIERLDARAREEGLANLTGRVMDGHHLDLRDHVFDIAGSQFGVTFFTDFRQGISELVRVIKPGGTVFLVSFGPTESIEYIGLFMHAIKAVVPDFESFSPGWPPLAFQVSEKDVLHRKMEEAGLRKVRSYQIVHKQFFRSGQEMWNWVTSSNPMVIKMIAGMDEEQKTQIRHILDEMIRQRAGRQDKAVFEAEVYIGLGEK